MGIVLLAAFISTLIVIGVAVFVASTLTQVQKTAVIEERLGQIARRQSESLQDLELQEPFYQRVIAPLVESFLASLGKLGPQQNVEQTRLNLIRAGSPAGLTPVMFMGIRIGLAVFLLVVAGFFSFNSSDLDLSKKLLYTGMGLVGGFILPGAWLGNKMKARQEEIVKALPDALDLLTVSVEAGLGFDIALQRVTAKWESELGREFKRMLSDMRLGLTRSQALKELSERTGVDDVQTFTSAVIQADQLGVSIAKILKIQSEQMRSRRRQRAEEKGRKAPVLMLLPMVLFIFPSIFVIILGPAVPKMMVSGF